MITSPLGGRIPSGLASEFVGPASLSTERNAAFFWSGLGKDGDEFAAAIARSKGGTTLEMLKDARGVKMPVWDPANPASQKAWNDLSRIYASSASGDVKVVLGKNINPQGTWQTVELPTLKGNENVSSIISVDPKTGTETVLWRR